MEPRAVARWLTRVWWLAFALCAVAAVSGGARVPIEAGPLRIDMLTLGLGAAVVLVSATVHGFSRRYMDGEARAVAFFARLSGLTAIVLLLLAADSMVLFLAAWVAMGWLLADLIGHIRHWAQARAAARLARIWFAAGALALAVALVGLGGQTGTASISGALASLSVVEPRILVIALLCLAVAALVQCALVPAHGWLLSSMTAPTPVSAFMHAGLVNAGGILLARFAPAFEAMPGMMLLVFVLGAASALAGAIAALVQTDVKRGLACSTVAQMGFMVLQCGLGFYAAAMAHLVLHGLYKASLFLGAGSALANARRPRAIASDTGGATGGGPAGRGATVAAALLAAIAAGSTFAMVSGKGTGGDTGLILVLFAGAAAAQAVAGLGQGLRPSAPALLLGAPVLMAGVGAFYGGLVQGASLALATVPGLTAPQPLSVVHGIAVVAVFGVWLAIVAGLHLRSPWLYARITAAAQPAAATLTTDRRAYHAG